MASIMYNRGNEALWRGNLGDINGTTKWKLRLYTNTYTPNKDHNVADLSGEVANGNGYTTGGQTLTSVTVTRDDINDLVKIDAVDPEWPTSTFTARWGVLIHDDVTDYPICALDFGGDITATNGTFKVQFHADGIINY